MLLELLHDSFGWTKKSFLILLGGFCLALFGSPSISYASHAQGNDLSYTCIGTNQYQFTLSFYRDCDGIAVGNAQTINLSSASCGQNFNINLSLVSGPTEVSPLCAAQLAQSTCASPPCTGTCLPGVEQYVYQGTFTFTQACSDWVVSFEECCRNNAVTTLDNPSNQSLFVSATLDNTNGLCNSSPVFTSSPVPYICADQLFCYNHGAVDPDGDSLVYSLVQPLDGPAPGTPIAYSDPSLNPNYPLFDNRGFIDFDSLTGSMCVNPVDTIPGQVFVVAVQVAEYRNGTLIGTSTRDIQVVVLQCINQQPQLNPNDINNLVGGIRVDSNSVEICPGVPLTFDIIADDLNLTDNVTMTSNVNLVAPGATFTTSGTNPVTGTVSWTPTATQTGFFNFTVTIQDDGCPILGSQIFNYDITVVPSTETTSDTTYCPAGSPVQLNAVGGTTFTWSEISGGPSNLSCLNCPNPTTAPSNTVSLEVLSNLSPICKNRDTVVVTVVPDFVLDAGNDTTICRFGLAQLNASATPTGTGFTPYSYNWTPADSLSSTNTANPTANPLDSTRYFLTVTSADGCTLTDSLDVNIDGVAPRVAIDPIDTICENAPLQLNSVVFQECGLTTNACTGPVTTGTIGAGGSSLRDYGPWVIDPGFQYSNIKQYIFTAAELNAMGFVGGGRISAIGLFVNTPGDIVTDVEIAMGCVADSAFLNSNFYTGLTQVQPAFNLTPVAGLNNIPLANPYMWDGLSSLVVEFCVNTQQALGTPSDVQYDSYPANMMCLFNDPFNPGACGATGGALFTDRPRMQFTFCEALPPTLNYSWTPTTFLDNPAIANPTTTPSSTITYTVSVDDGTCTGSDAVTVNVATLFNLDVGNDTTLCLNQPYQANAVLDPGTYTYSWTPLTGVNNPVAEDPIILAIDTTDYILTANRSGCEVSDTLTINIDGISPIVLAQLDTAICPIGGAASLNTLITQNCGPTAIPCSGPVNTGLIGDPAGFSSSLYGPHFIFLGASYSLRRQFIVTAAELDAMGFVGGGRINSIALDYTSAGEANTDVTVKMGCTTLDEFDASLAFIPNLDVVFPSASVTPTLGLVTYNFATPFMWDGTSNLVIEFCTDALQTGTTATSFSEVRFAQTGTSNRTLYQNLFNVTGACSSPTGLARTFFRPNFSFSYCQAQPTGLTYTWSPSTTLDNSGIPAPTASPTVTTTYNVVVSSGGQCDGGDNVTVSIDSTNFVDALQNTLINCPAPSYQLNAAVTGPQFVPALPNCGINGTVCSQTLYSGQVGTATTSTNTFYSPFWTTTTDFRSQYLYRAADLTAAGISSGTITAIAFNIVSINDSLPLDALTFRMGCTTDNNLSTTTGFLPTSNVLGPIPFARVTGLNVFTLANPFDWDGTSNIVVEVCNTNATTAAAANVEYTDGLGYDATMLQFVGAPGCNLAATGGVVQQGRPNIQFNVCPPPPTPFTYNWSPSTGLSNPSTDSPVYTDPTPSVADTFTVLVTGGACDVFDTVIVPPCTLPVEYLELFGEQDGPTVKLDWLTRFEVNVGEFRVERSAHGEPFREIARENAAGNTTSDTWYELVDPQPQLGENIYRVVAIDLDGAQTQSNAVTINFTNTSGLVGLYPNPTRERDGFFVEYFAERAAALEIELIDVYGRTVSRRAVSLEAGSNKFAYATQSIAQGTYFVRFRFGDQRELRKLVIVE